MKKEEHNARFRDHYIAIGIRISYFRKLRGLSQEQLAERAGNLTIDPLQTAQAAPWGGLFSISALSARSGWR